jgi:hypothetical protein
MWHFSSALASVLLMFATYQPPNPPNIPPGGSSEILVKLAPQTDAGRKLTRAAEKGTEPSGEIADYVAALSRELSVPLEAKRLGSGGTMLLGVRVADLSEAVAKTLGRQASIASAHVTSGEAAAGPQIQVDFAPGSREAGIVAKAKDAAASTDPAVTDLTRRFQRASGVPLEPQIDAAGQFLLRIDLQKLTDQLVAGLKKRPEIEYAQPNYTYRLRRTR